MSRIHKSTPAPTRLLSRFSSGRLGSKGADTIYGGSGADSILGTAAAGDDKLYGDAGNDRLTEGAGSDTFVYGSGDGKDVITDYTANQDKIKLTSGEIIKTAYSGNNVIFTVGSGTLTVKNAKGKAITITEASDKTSTKTYTTGVTYASNDLHGSNSLWFTEDDTSFINRGDSKLDEISDIEHAVTNFETSNVDKFVTNDSISSASSALTFTK